MSYSIDANILLYASNREATQHKQALDFLIARAHDPDLFCLTWPVLMAYLRIATHPTIFANPLSTLTAWNNIQQLLKLPRVRLITEEHGFESDFASILSDLAPRGNLVPDTHIAALLRQHGVRCIYTTDSDFRKFDFLEVRNPFKS